jgi:hypothetical protein
MRRSWLRVQVTGILTALLVACGAMSAAAQELGGAGTVQGTVKDPTGAVLVGVTVTIGNPVTGFKRQVATDQAGRFVFRNVPPNSYHIEVAAQGFGALEQDVDVRTSVPIELTLALQLATEASTVQVTGHATDPRT